MPDHSQGLVGIELGCGLGTAIERGLDDLEAVVRVLGEGVSGRGGPAHRDVRRVGASDGE